MAKCPECGGTVGRWDLARMTGWKVYNCRGCGAHIRPKTMDTILFVVVALVFGNVDFVRMEKGVDREK